MFFHRSLSDSKSPQVFRTLLSILSVLNDVVVWMVSNRPPTSKSSSPFNNALVNVPKAPITMGIIFTFMLHSFFQFPSMVDVIILLFTIFQFYSLVSQDSSVNTFAISLFLLITISFVLLAEMSWSVYMSESQRSLCVIFLWVYHLFIW